MAGTAVAGVVVVVVVAGTLCVAVVVVLVVATDAEVLADDAFCAGCDSVSLVVVAVIVEVSFDIGKSATMLSSTLLRGLEEVMERDSLVAMTAVSKVGKG